MFDERLAIPSPRVVEDEWTLEEVHDAIHYSRAYSEWRSEKNKNPGT